MPKYDRACSRCGTIVETIERMLEDAPIPCVACDGSMVRASWLVRPAIACEKATSVANDQPVTLPDGSKVKIRNAAEARSIEKNFDGLVLTQDHKSMSQEATMKKKDQEKATAKAIKDMYIETYKQVKSEGTE